MRPVSTWRRAVESDPTFIVLQPSDVDGFRPSKEAISAVRASVGNVVIRIGPSVPFFSTTASLVLQLIDIVVQRGDEVTVESSPLKVDVLRVLGFESLARLLPDPNDDSWLLGR